MNRRLKTSREDINYTQVLTVVLPRDVGMPWSASALKKQRKPLLWTHIETLRI